MQGTADSRSDGANGIVRLVYRAALEPMAFADFIDALRLHDPDLSDDAFMGGLVEHLDLASSLAAEKDKDFSRPSLCTIRFDESFRVAAMDPQADQEFAFAFSSLTPGGVIEVASEDVADSLQEGMRVLHRARVTRYPLILEQGARRCCCYLAKSADGYVLSLIRNHVLEEFDLSASFLHELTQTERTICLALFEGLSPPEAAARMGVAPSTVKSHLKSVFAKLGINRQVDLIRLLDQAFLLERELNAAMAQARPPLIDGQAQPPEPLSFSQPAKQIVEGVRSIAFRDYGPDDGAPVLYFHGAFSCGRLSPAEVTAGRRCGLRLIAIDRPGYGESGKAAPSMETASADCAAVLDYLNIERVAALGFAKGSLFALAFAATSPERIKAIYLSGVSFGSNHDLKRLNRRAQFVDLLLRRYPSAAASVARLFLRPQTEESFRRQLEKIWSDSTPDFAALHDDALVLHLRESVNEALAHGVEGPIFDYLSLREARVDLSRVCQPVTAWHGRSDISLTIPEARAALAPVPDLRFISVEGRGQLMFHTDFENIAAMIASA